MTFIILILKCVRMALSEVTLLNLLDLDQWSFWRRTKKKEYKSFSLFFPSSFSEEDLGFHGVSQSRGFLQALLFLLGSEVSQRQKCSAAASCRFSLIQAM